MRTKLGIKQFSFSEFPSNSFLYRRNLLVVGRDIKQKQGRETENVCGVRGSDRLYNVHTNGHFSTRYVKPGISRSLFQISFNQKFIFSLLRLINHTHHPSLVSQLE